MKKLIILILVLALCGCAAPEATVPNTTIPETTVPVITVPETTIPETSVPPTTVPETTVPETTVPPTTIPLHSEFFLEDHTLEDLLIWWDEVVLQSEYSDGTGDPSRVQKWLFPILYSIEGEPTEEDLAVLEGFIQELNQIDGFPGITMAEGMQQPNLTLHFVGPDAFYDNFSEVVGGEDAWGAVQYWYYTDTNEIHTARIGYRTDIPQLDRNSILLEEIINGLGISDTDLRPDSIVYQHSNANLSLSEVDWLILKLLYHPDIGCGMDRDSCHSIIENLYH